MKHRLAQWLRARADKLDPPAAFTVTVRSSAEWSTFAPIQPPVNQCGVSYR